MFCLHNMSDSSFTDCFHRLDVGRTPNSDEIRGEDRYGGGDADGSSSADEGTVCSEGSRVKITENETVEWWKNELLSMHLDMSTRHGDFLHQIEISTNNDVEKWFAACYMGKHKDFSLDRTVDLSEDIEDYVKQRLLYVLDCLQTMEGIGDQQYTKEMYIGSWNSDINDRWQWTSLLSKWRAQFDYMEKDLIKLFGGKQALQDSLGGPTEWKAFRKLLFLDDDDFEEEDDPDCTLDYCTDVDTVVSFVKETIGGIVGYLRVLQHKNDEHGSYITTTYIDPFMRSLSDDSEWETLLNVSIPSTETLFY